jgi:Xaa-Pro dipeptidase
MKNRRDKLRDRLPEIGVDAFLSMKQVNVRYLTGFSGSNGQVVVGAEDVFLTDPRYEEQSSHEVPDMRREIYFTSAKMIGESGGMMPTLAAAVASLGAKRLAVEASFVTLATARALRDALPGVELIETDDEIERLRIVKDPSEVAALRKACSFADDALTALLPQLKEGMTEVDVATILEFEMRKAGSEGLSFPTICAFGEQAAEPHHQPTERKLARGDLIKLDFGATCRGYHSDMTRTVAFGEPSPEMRKLYELVQASQQAGLDVVRAGATGGDVDAASRGFLEERGYDFGHGTGHGLGLEVHEAPAVRRGGGHVLEAGTTITVEPGIYIPGTGGIRIEDSVAVTEDGCDILTGSTKELVVV